MIIKSIMYTTSDGKTFHDPENAKHYELDLFLKTYLSEIFGDSSPKNALYLVQIMLDNSVALRQCFKEYEKFSDSLTIIEQV